MNLTDVDFANRPMNKGIEVSSELQGPSNIETQLSNAQTDDVTSAEETESDKEERSKKEAAIMSILAQQNIVQFRHYAKEEHPKDLLQQEELIQQMQDQYFEYYLENVYRKQIYHQEKQIEQINDLRNAARSEALQRGEQFNEQDFAEPTYLELVPASVWTRRDIVDFKKEILSTQRECCFKVASLSIATLRVPTHEEGTSIHWEFATDSYDIGFGLYFEWSLTPPESITMTVSESSDEEDFGETEESEGQESITPQREVTEDLESGNRQSESPPTDELIPVYRRECHQEVYCGSHPYPGCGVYVFKFDNSYSLWRSKWLYYRVFYSK